jgi:cytidylate kinase
MALVTISAAYGALGSEVGRRLADRLDVPFLDRAITAGVAQRLALPLAEAESLDESPATRVERLLASFTQMGSLFGVTPALIEAPTDEATFRRATEDIIRQQAASGSAVIVGRAAMIVLAEHPHVVRVRLTGPRDARIQQAVRLHGLTRDEAERQARASDGVREAWVQRFYGRDVKDPSLYDLVINATRFDAEACVELIAQTVAAEAAR